MTDEISPEFRLFKRREKAVIAGRRWPTEEELLRDMAFHRNDRTEDMREFGNRLARPLRKRKRPDLASLISCLEGLTVDPSKDAVVAVEEAMDSIQDTAGLPIDAIRRRCLIYKASFGDPDAAAAIAGEKVKLAAKDIKSTENMRMLGSALAWSAFSRDMAARQRAGGYRGASMGLQIEPKLRSYSALFQKAIEQPMTAEKKAGTASSHDIPDVEVERPVSADAPHGDTVIVLREVGNASVSQGKDVAREFQKIAGRALPLPATPDLAAVRARLVAEFPYANQIIDQMLKGLVGRPHVRFRPTILVGPPGCGKSRFARRLAEELGVSHELIPCGGMSDGALGGTPRRWSSGEPSLPILTVRRHECAGPIIILDEIEKVGTERQNGNVHDVLLGLFEPETSSRWHDPYVQAACDLSHLTWLMTANAIEPIPAVLRDRCRILRFPEPGPEHLPMLATRIMERIYAELGHDARWAMPLEGFELEAIASAWSGGSIRRLERIIERLVEVREQERAPQ